MRILLLLIISQSRRCGVEKKDSEDKYKFTLHNELSMMVNDMKTSLLLLFVPLLTLDIFKSFKYFMFIVPQSFSIARTWRKWNMMMMKKVFLYSQVWERVLCWSLLWFLSVLWHMKRMKLRNLCINFFKMKSSLKSSHSEIHVD